MNGAHLGGKEEALSPLNHRCAVSFFPKRRGMLLMPVSLRRPRPSDVPVPGDAVADDSIQNTKDNS